MLRYAEFCLSPFEVPREQSICIYISGCINRCKNCHYPDLQRTDYGESLCENFSDIIDIYSGQATCVCFLGEGGGLPEEKQEFVACTNYARIKNIKTALYSGRDTDIEPWMYIFDYIKLGSYREELGSLDSKTTNQRLFRKNHDGEYVDITELFWQG